MQSNSHKLRSALAAAIRNHIKQCGMTGKQAAAKAGVAGSRISAIINDKLEGMSSDAIADILGGLGYKFGSVIGSNRDEGFHVSAVSFVYGKGSYPDTDLSVIPADIAQPEPIGAPHE